MELQMLRLGEACAALGMSRKTLKRYERLGLLRPVRDAADHRRFPIEELRRFRESMIAEGQD